MPVNVSSLIRSKRKTIALIVERDGSITVRAPFRMSAAAIEEFVEKHTKWVEKKQAEVESIIPEPPRRYEAGERFLYLGEAYPLEIVAQAKQPLVLDHSFKLAKAAQPNAEITFREWYRQQAVRLIHERVAYFAKKFSLDVKSIRITSARTRWGSCSVRGSLSFSWRLLMTPPAVIDYVVVHELAYTVHHNHSRHFWALMETWMPDYKERRRQLRQYRDETI